MIAKHLILSVVALSLVVMSCKDDKKTQEILDNQIKQIEATEVVIDSTVKAVSEKASEVETLLKEIDSI